MIITAEVVEGEGDTGAEAVTNGVAELKVSDDKLAENGENPPASASKKKRNRKKGGGACKFGHVRIFSVVMSHALSKLRIPCLVKPVRML